MDYFFIKVILTILVFWIWGLIVKKPGQKWF